MEQWYVSDITKAVESCIILHNMMVEERVDWDKNESHSWCDYNNNDNVPIIPAEEFVEQQQAETDLHHHLQEFFMMVLPSMLR